MDNDYIIQLITKLDGSKTADDVKKYITELETKLLNSLEEDTIINIEF